MPQNLLLKLKLRELILQSRVQIRNLALQTHTYMQIHIQTQTCTSIWNITKLSIWACTFIMRQLREAFSKAKYPYMNYCLLVECLRDAISYHDMHLSCSIQSDIFNLFWKIAYFVSANICYSYFWWQAQLKKMKYCTIFAIHPSIITHKIILWKIQPEWRWFTKHYLFQNPHT